MRMNLLRWWGFERFRILDFGFWIEEGRRQKTDDRVQNVKVGLRKAEKGNTSYRSKTMGRHA
jgi:hypothetical protein